MLESLIENILSGDSIGFIDKLSVFSRTQRSKIVNTTYLNKDSEYDNSNCLLVACLKRQLTVVKFLVKECGADLEQLVLLNYTEDWDNMTFFTQYTNNEYHAKFNYTAPVLWHMCRNIVFNELEIIAYLVSVGADANSKQETLCNSTPLM